MTEIDRNNSRGWPKTKQQDDLCHAIVVQGLSQADAGRTVGYAASTIDHKLSTIVKKLAPYIDHLRSAKQQVIERNFEVTVDRVFEELSAMGLANPKDYLRVVEYRGVGMVIGKSPMKLTDDQARAVEGWNRVKVVTDGGYDFDYQYRFYDRRQALRDMGQHLGMYNEKIILEQRITKTYRVDLSQVPDEILEHWMQELRGHGGQVPDKGTGTVIDHDTGIPV